MLTRLYRGLGLVGLLLLLHAPVQANTLNFAQFPTVVRAATSNYSSTYDYATYTFEIQVPADSGTALGGVVLTIPDTVGRVTVPEPGDVKVVAADGQPFASQVTVEGQRVLIALNPPAAPGQKISILLYPMRNPRPGGTYLFDTQVYPAGNPGQLSFIGFGRITFYEPGHR